MKDGHHNNLQTTIREQSQLLSTNNRNIVKLALMGRDKAVCAIALGYLYTEIAALLLQHGAK